MIRDPHFHRRGDSQGLMNPAEVVVGKVQAIRSQKVLHFLLKVFVSRVRRRTHILIVRFWPFHMPVQTRRVSGFPMTGTTSTETTSGWRVAPLFLLRDRVIPLPTLCAPPWCTVRAPDARQASASSS